MENGMAPVIIMNGRHLYFIVNYVRHFPIRLQRGIFKFVVNLKFANFQLGCQRTKFKFVLT